MKAVSEIDSVASATSMPGPWGTALRFSVEPDRVRYFADWRGQAFTPGLLTQAEDHFRDVVQHWAEDGRNALETLESIGPVELDGAVRISVLPPSFCIGAAETRGRLILFGQPIRCRSYSTAIIAHEIAHIVTARSTEQNRLVMEVISMLVEAEVYWRTERTPISLVWQSSRLDEFHAVALEIASSLLGTAAGEAKSWMEFAAHVRNCIPPQVLSLEPATGLLRNIGPATLGGGGPHNQDWS